MDSPIPELTRDDVAAIIAEAAAELNAAERQILQRHAIPVRQAVRRANGGGRLPVWLFAADGRRVVGYDEVEEEFGSGLLVDSNEVQEWVTFGDRLAWALVYVRPPSA